jgi:hypothetical protein
LSDVLTAYELYTQMVAKSAEIDQALTEYKSQALAHADAEVQAERAQALARPGVKKELGPKATVGDIKAAVFLLCGDQILNELRTDALRNGSDRALKAYLAQLSALQSLASALREEIRLNRTDNYTGGP